MEPSKGELKKALGKLKSDKVGGSSVILPEMVKVACEEEFLELLLALVHTVWGKRRVPQEWVDATIIPIPKEGTSVTATTEGGLLYWMYIVGKVVARVI